MELYAYSYITQSMRHRKTYYLLVLFGKHWTNRQILQTPIMTAFVKLILMLVKKKRNLSFNDFEVVS